MSCLGYSKEKYGIICFRRMRHRNSSHGLLSRVKKKRISQQETQMIVLLGLMTVVFVVCYLPILVSGLSNTFVL